MSFTQNIKENISKIKNKCDFCDTAELSALTKLCTNYQQGEIIIITENDAVASRIQYLFGCVFDTDIGYVNKNGTYRFCPDFDFFVNTAADRLMLFGSEYEGLMPYECCRQAYLRGAFLGGGSVSNPDSRYHLEFDARYEVYAYQLCEILENMGIKSKVTYRKGRYIVYIKECEAIADVLGVLGDVSAAMEFYNALIEKRLRNDANRRLNCDMANIDKITKSSAQQVMAVKKIEKEKRLSELPDTLREIAMLRVQYPSDSLKELGEKTNPPIGKSGVNHRLKRLIEIADKL